MANAQLAPSIDMNAALLESTIKSAQIGFQMTGIQPVPVGASKFPTSRHNLSILIGLMGEWTGSFTLNMSMDLAFLLSEGLLGEKVEEFNEQVLDAVGETANMVCGAFKDSLDRSEFSIDGITCPSVVMGQSYEFYYAAGFTTVCVDFEVDEIPITKMSSRLFSVGVSIMKR